MIDLAMVYDYLLVIYTIYNPLNKYEIIKKSALNFKKNTFKKNKLKIINIARLTDQKDHLTLIKALNILKKDIQFNLVIIGYGVNKSLILFCYVAFLALEDDI